jgi:hypothetical protein
MFRPSFSAAWAASIRIYDPYDTKEKVARVIGGRVKQNIENPDPTQAWKNTCAVRMSYILNQTGVVIPAMPGQTVSGADGCQYFYRIKNIIAFS